MNSKIRFPLVAILFFLLISCSNNGDVDRFLQAEQAAGQDLASLDVTAKSLLVNPGETVQFSVMGVTNDGVNTTVDNTVVWESSDSSVVTVNASGIATAHANGTAQIVARLAHLQSSLTFNVNQADLIDINLQAVTETDECRAVEIDVTGRFDDGSDRLISGLVGWASSDSSLATVLSEEDGAQILAHNAGVVTITAESGSVKTTAELMIQDTLTSFIVTPRNTPVSTGSNQQYKATGTWTDGETGDMTESVRWSVSDTDIANFDSEVIGLLTATTTVGETGIIADCGGIQVDQPLQTRKNEIVRVEINSNRSKITLDTNDDGYQLTLRSVNSDGSEADVTEDAEWSKVSPSDITIQVSDDEDSRGELTITGTGTANIEATYEGLSDTILIVVE